LIDNVVAAHQINPQSLRWRVDPEDEHLMYMRELQPLICLPAAALKISCLTVERLVRNAMMHCQLMTV